VGNNLRVVFLQGVLIVYKKVVILLFLIFIIGCNSIEEDNYIIIDNEYTIVRSDLHDAYMKVALQFKNTAEQLTGTPFKIITDWKSNPITDKEIIIGKTTREDTYFEIDRTGIDFIITVVGERLLIIGGDDEGTMNGVNYFFENNMSRDGSIRIPKDYYYKQIKEKRRDTPMIAVLSVKAREIVERRPVIVEDAFWELLNEALEIPGIDLILLPQYSVQKPQWVKTLSNLAREHNVYIVYSTEVTAENGGYYCESVILDREGNEFGRYRQTHAFSGYDVGIGVGDDLPIFELDFGKVAIMSGSDILYPEVAEIYSVKGAEILLYQAGITPLQDDSELMRILKGRAVADYCFVATATYASENSMYFVSNIEGHGNTKFFPYGTDISGHYNGMGLGFHTGRACIFDLRGDIIASTGRETGVASAKIPMYKKRGIKDYIFGPAEIVYHQNKRGVFDELTAFTYTPPEPEYKRFVKLAMCHLPYSYTIHGQTDYARVFEWTEKAAQTGADLVMTSEFAAAYEPGEDVFARFAELAATYGCYIAANMGKPTGENISYLWDREGKLVFTYEKINNLCMMYDQQEPAGSECPVYDTDFGRIAIMVCADTYSQEIPRVYGVKGVDLILLQSQSWGYDTTAIGEGVLCAYAIENCLYIAHNNFPHSQVDSRSLVIDPTGFIAAATPYNQEGIIETILDLSAVREKPCYVFGEKGIEFATDYKERLLSARRPSLYGLLAGK